MSEGGEGEKGTETLYFLQFKLCYANVYFQFLKQKVLYLYVFPSVFERKPLQF